MVDKSLAKAANDVVLAFGTQGVLEIVDCISNWTLLATVGSTSSMLLAVVAFNVVSTILLGYQLGTLYWHFHLGLNSPGKVLDVPRTDSNEWWAFARFALRVMRTPFR